MEEDARGKHGEHEGCIIRPVYTGDFCGDLSGDFCGDFCGDSESPV